MKKNEAYPFFLEFESIFQFKVREVKSSHRTALLKNDALLSKKVPGKLLIQRERRAETRSFLFPDLVSKNGSEV